MENTRNAKLNQKLSWGVYNKVYKKILGYNYDCYKFKFVISKYEDQQEFSDLITVTHPLIPWDVCNFLLKKKIPYSINFKYSLKAGFKANYTLFNTVLKLKFSHLKLIIESYSNLRFEKTI